MKSFRLLFFLGLFLLAQLDYHFLFPVVPFLSKEFEVPPGAIGFGVSIYSFVGVITALLVAPWASRKGTLRTVVLGAWALVLSTAATVFSPTLEFFYIARGFSGIAGSILAIYCLILVVEGSTPKTEKWATGGIAGSAAFAAVFAPPLSAFLADQFGWRGIFFGLLFLSLGFAILLSANSSATSILKPQKNLTLKETSLNYLEFFKDLRYRRGLSVAFLNAVSSTAVVVYFGAWITLQLGFKMEDLTFYFLVIGVTSILGSLGGGQVSSYFKGNTFLQIINLLAAVCLVGVFLVSSSASVLAFTVLLGLVLSLREAPFQSWIVHLAPKERRPSFLSLRSLVSKVGIALAAALGGFLYDWGGFESVCLFSALACILTFFALRFQNATPPVFLNQKLASIKN